MCLRAAIVYGLALLMVRTVGDRRFAGKYAAFDIVLSVMLGATLSQAISNSSKFLPVLLASLTLVVLHWLLGMLTFRLPWVEKWVKGQPQVLVQAGQTNDNGLRKSHLTKKDLQMALRAQNGSSELSHVARAILETNGEISVEQSSSVRVVDISVAEGVQTVRISIS